MASLDIKFDMGGVYPKIQVSKGRILVLRGGTSSGKTFSMCQAVAGWLFNGLIGDLDVQEGIFSIGRQFSATLKSSVMRDFYKVLENADLHWQEDGEYYGKLIDLISVNKSDKTFKYRDRTVEFIGCDDYHKSKGPRRKFLWLNEADEIRFSVFTQLNMRTKIKTFIDFNPDDEDVWINQEIEIARAMRKNDVDVVVSTYKDNPFLDESEIEEIEDLKRDPMMWQVFGCGEYGKIKGRIFDFEEIGSVPKEAELLGYGLDFGFSNDPSALIGLYRWNGKIILDEVLYATGMHNSDIAKVMKQEGISKREDVVCDSAEPKSIHELYNLGFNTSSVKKGKDSIVYGLSCMQQFDILITKRSVNMKKEFKRYKWAENKEGELGLKPVGKNDHAIDAARYVCMTKLPKSRRSGGKFLIGSV